VQVNGRNWLVPKGAVVNSEADVEDETVRADYVLDQMDLARNQLNIVILDACRNNPFGRSLRSAGRGLAPVQASSNTVVGYATAPNDVAQDGAGANSPYATALAAEIGGGSDPIEITLRKVTARVKQATGNKQSPFVSTNLDREFRFRAVPGPSAQRPAAPGGSGTAPAPQPSPGVSVEEQELEAWRSLGADPSKAELEAFLKAFPNGKYAGLARAKIKTIEERERAQARPAAPAPSTTAPAETRPAQVAGPGKDCAECPEMVRIPGRSFMAGKYEVTFAEWDACVAGGGCNGYRPEDRGWGRGRRPVINVNWNDAQAYVQWLSNRTGKRYRLLTSEEWEFAARAGTTSEYSWGNEEPVCNESARNGANFDACPDDRTRPVGSFPANGFGLHDVHGNVWEWVEDCYEGNCRRRVLRGCSWFNNPQDLRSADRIGDVPSDRSGLIGFRVARTL
ncbi:MAG: SUMF1/EgtB/PvdO family nonheme iron enzyme, partial [Gemmatimonadetes bacterium]|nr:SUMF1/EgtB/PvdO family nonheme iron enzyme [Gemmatimonadota bacterium]